MTTTKKKLASIAISVQPRCFHTLTHLASPAMMGALTKDFALGDWWCTSSSLCGLSWTIHL